MIGESGIEFGFPFVRRRLCFLYPASGLLKFRSIVGTGPQPFAAGGVENRLPTLVYDTAGTGQVVWVRDGNLVHACSSTRPATCC